MKPSVGADQLKEQAIIVLGKMHRAYHSQKSDLPERLNDPRSPETMLNWMSQCWSASACLLFVAQGAFIVEGDKARAKALFAEIADWLPCFEASVGAEGAVAMEYQGKPLRFDAREMLEPLICALLAGERLIAERMAHADENVYLGRKDLDQEGFSTREFVLDICRLIRGESGDQIGLADIRRVGTRDMLPGYEKLLRAIARNDAKGFEGHVAELSQAYRLRSRSREQAGDAFGFGKLAQSMTFDALGTALCRLAVWRGMNIQIENPLYPPEFWH